MSSVWLQSGCLSLFVHDDFIFSVNESGTVARFEVDFESLSVAQIESKDQIFSQSGPLTFIERTGGIFSVISPTFSGYHSVSLKTGRVARVATSSPISAMTSSGSYIAATTRCSTFVYENDKLSVALNDYRSEPTCAAVSDAFRIVVVGTGRGSLVVFDIPSGLPIREVELGGATAQKVMVAESCGLIVVLTMKNDVVVFSMNGTFVRKAALKRKVARWATWASNGIDFLALAPERKSENERPKFSLAEAFSLNLKVFRCASPSDIVSFCYIREHQALMVGQRDGNANFFFDPCRSFDTSSTETSGIASGRNVVSRDTTAQ
jgi:hypothetical protein